MLENTHILYIEDNEGTARLLQKRLSRAGYKIDVAQNGEAGLELYAAHPYNAVIVDYNLPGLNGIQIIKHLAAQGAMPPTILLTGSGNEQIAVEALKIGAFDYVVKDIDGIYFDLLPTVIEQALKNQQLLEEKRRAEKALYESEQRFRNVIEQSLDGIALINQEGKIIEWNRSQEAITNVPREEALGQYIWDVIYRRILLERTPESFYQFLKDAFEEMLQGGKSSFLENVFEYEFFRPDGERRTVQVARYLIDLGDHFLVSEVSRDISERKRMEDALRESEERFRMLFEEAPDPYIVADLTGNLVACNRAVEPLLGLRVDELVGKNFTEMEVLFPGQLEKVAHILTEASEGLLTGPTELTVTRSDGREVVIDLRMILIQNKGQTHILGIGHDITWRTQVEAYMKAHIEQLEVLHEIDDRLTQKLDLEYVLKMATEMIPRLTGANAGGISIIDNGVVQQIHSFGYPEPLDPEYFLDKPSVVLRVIRQKKAEWVQDVTTDPDYFDVLADTCSQITIPLVSQERLVGIINLETNQPEHFSAEMFEFVKLVAARIAVAIDNARLYDTSQQQLAEMQNLYEQISKLEQLKTDMVRIVSHDVRNELAVITTSMGLLARSLTGAIAENQQRYIRQINQSIEQIKALTTDVLSLERIERLVSDEGPSGKVDLREIIKDLVETARTQAEQKNQRLNFSAPDLPVEIRGTKTEFQQATSNLISNAIKYTPEGGRIDVVLQTRDEKIYFEVTDTGFGIPEGNQVNLFQPFERVKTEETRSIEGTGLGLYTVKKIIERNSGEIIFHSEYGKGSTFGFALPLA